MVAVAEAQIVEDWVRQFDSGDSDVARGLALDGAGNIYVAGYSCEPFTILCDYTVVKYAPNGDELWSHHYDYAPYDITNTMTVDDAGNVYVTGVSGEGDVVASWDFATVKYDAQGNQLWVRRYDHGGSDGDSAYALAVDGAGNVYVAGSSYDPVSLTDYATIKYSPEGDELWVRRYDNGAFDVAAALTLDAAGNVYVTGRSHNPLGWNDRDYATIKYDADGNALWVSRYDYGPSDEACALAVDGAGNVYVTGISGGDTLTSWDFATVKYDPEGNELWVSRYDHQDLYDGANALNVDIVGNVYVTGTSWDAVTGADYATVKYDPEGGQLWVSRYDHQGLDDGPSALTMDVVGNVYVTGHSDDAITGIDFATVKYDPEGDQLWVGRYDREDLAEGGVALTLDDVGNVYVTGDRFTTVKYVQTLTPQEMMANAIAFYQEGLEDDTILGTGEGSAATAHEQLFGRMLDKIHDLILREDCEQACRKLSAALLRIDGEEPPPDLVGGVAAPSLQEMLLDIYSALGG